MDYRYEYHLAPTARDQAFIDSGQRPDAVQTRPFDPVLLSRPARQAITAIEAHGGEAGLLRLGTYESTWAGVQLQPVLLEGEPSMEELEQHLIASAASLAAAQAAQAEYRHQEAARRAEVEAREAERLAAERAMEAAGAAQRAAERAEREAAKRAWIPAHGSEHLCRAFARGYDCQRLYVSERAALEYPGFRVDFDDLAAWKERACPSLPALDLLEALPPEAGAEVVWLTEPVETRSEHEARVQHEAESGWEDDSPGRWEPCEAMVIGGYLGRYNLIRLI